MYNADRFRSTMDTSSMYLHTIYTDDKGSHPEDIGNLWDPKMCPKESHGFFCIY